MLLDSVYVHNDRATAHREMDRRGVESVTM
jgi:hypothetical protein